MVLKKNNNIVSQKEFPEDKKMDLSLRPKVLDEFIGQEKLKANLEIFIKAAQQRGESLDHALFHGGHGLGKCITSDSIVFTEKGMVQIGQLGDLNKKGFQEKKVSLYSIDDVQKTSHFYNNGKRKTIKIKSHQGFQLEGTLNHPIVSLDNTGNIVFKELKNFKKGDYVAIGRGQNYFGQTMNLPKFVFQQGKNNIHKYRDTTIPKKMSKGLARLLGYLIGDGYIGKTGEIAFYNENDEILKDYIKIWKNLFNQGLKVSKWKKKCRVIRAKNQKIRKFLLSTGLSYNTASTKQVPSFLFQCSKEIVKEFLRAYFECDACAGKKDRRVIELTSCSQKLLEEVHLILLNFSIVSRLRPKWNYEYNRDYWHLFITGEDTSIFDKQIGFISQKKRATSLAYIVKHNTNKDLVPFGKDKIREIKQLTIKLNRFLSMKHRCRTSRYEISSATMNRCLDQIEITFQDVLEDVKSLRQMCNPKIFWDKIDSIETGKAQTVDVAIPTNHTFFANGFINHNTTLSYIIAREMGTEIQVTSGPALEKVGDLAAILTSLEDKSILFIDEIHRLNRTIEEILYPAMEEYALDLIVGQGPSAKILRLDLPQFTLIGATTRPSLVSPPLRDRFGATYQLNFYQVLEIKQIVLRSADILKIKIDQKAAQEIAQRSRFTPRVANRLLKRVRDFAQVHDQGKINQKIAKQALEMLEIDHLGLNQTDRRILSCLIEKFSGGPVGIKTLAVATGEDLNSIEEIYEPYLIQSGFLNRTLRGRTATDLAYQHLGFKNTLL